MRQDFTHFKHVVIFSLISFLIFFSLASGLSLADVIYSDGMMAIGTVEIYCNNYTAAGFCTRLFRNLSAPYGTELQLFDMKPEFSFCKIDCAVKSAEIYDYEGNKLNLTVIHDNLSGKSDAAFLILNGRYPFVFVMLLALFVTAGLIMNRTKNRLSRTKAAKSGKNKN